MGKLLKKNLISIFIIFVFGLTIFLTKNLVRNDRLAYQIANPKIKTISKIIDAYGVLEVKDSLKIGSLVTGIVKKVLIQEGQKVKKGQVLAIIDNGKEDTDVELCKAEIFALSGKVIFQRNHFARIKELFMEGFVSQDEFEQERGNIVDLEGRLKVAKIKLRKAKLEYENTQIKAPEDGTVGIVGVTEGEAVTSSLNATVLFEMARDLSALQAVFQVDETDIAWIAVGQDVTLTFEAGQTVVLDGKISKIGFSPRTKNGVVTFKVFVDVNDENLRLRPGTSVSASIITCQAKNVMSLPGQAFSIGEAAICAISKKLKYDFVPLCPEKPGVQSKKTVWVVKGNSFVEKELAVGINDGVNYQIISGLEPEENVVVDIDEKNVNEELFKKAFKKF